MAIDEKKLKEDLIQWFAHKKKFCKDHLYDSLLEDYEECFDEFTDIIEAQPKLSLETKTSDWIPCSERLPKQNQRIIGTFYNDEDCRAFVGEATYFPDILDTPYPLIAWTPLPEPYKGE